MREIKFRAWDKIDKKIRDWEYFLLNPDMLMRILSLCKVSNSEYTFSNQAYSKVFELELMQFTGLLDCKGVEIYEQMEINGKYRVIYQAPKYVLQDISNSDIINIYEKNKLEITGEYSPIS